MRGEERAGAAYRMGKRTCGLILSLSDVGVLFAGSILTWFALEKVEEYSLFIPFVLVHFFLFCNVFRIRRKQELTWAAAFIINVLFWSVSGRYPIFILFGTQMLLTAVIIIMEMMRPDYHGIFSRYINKNLDDYLMKN